MKPGTHRGAPERDTVVYPETHGLLSSDQKAFISFLRTTLTIAGEKGNKQNQNLEELMKDTVPLSRSLGSSEKYYLKIVKIG